MSRQQCVIQHQEPMLSASDEDRLAVEAIIAISSACGDDRHQLWSLDPLLERPADDMADFPPMWSESATDARVLLTTACLPSMPDLHADSLLSRVDSRPPGRHTTADSRRVLLTPSCRPGTLSDSLSRVRTAPQRRSGSSGSYRSDRTGGHPPVTVDPTPSQPDAVVVSKQRCVNDDGPRGGNNKNSRPPPAAAAACGDSSRKTSISGRAVPVTGRRTVGGDGRPVAAAVLEKTATADRQRPQRARQDQRPSDVNRQITGPGLSEVNRVNQSPRLTLEDFSNKCVTDRLNARRLLKTRTERDLSLSKNPKERETLKITVERLDRAVEMLEDANLVYQKNALEKRLSELSVTAESLSRANLLPSLAVAKEIANLERLKRELGTKLNRAYSPTYTPIVQPVQNSIRNYIGDKENRSTKAINKKQKTTHTPIPHTRSIPTTTTATTTTTTATPVAPPSTTRLPPPSPPRPVVTDESAAVIDRPPLTPGHVRSESDGEEDLFFGSSDRPIVGVKRPPSTSQITPHSAPKKANTYKSREFLSTASDSSEDDENIPSATANTARPAAGKTLRRVRECILKHRTERALSDDTDDTTDDDNDEGQTIDSRLCLASYRPKDSGGASWTRDRRLSSSSEGDSSDSEEAVPPKDRPETVRTCRTSAFSARYHRVNTRNQPEYTAEPSPTYLKKCQKLVGDIKRDETFKCRPITAKNPAKYINIPHVTVSGKDTADSSFGYPASLDLVSLEDVARRYTSIDLNRAILRQNSFGDMLKRYSYDKITGGGIHDDVNVETNHETDLTVYHLVWGAVPRQYKDVCARILADRHRRAKTESSGSFAERMNLFAGEVELLTYIYWQLSTRDLIDYKNDIRRAKIKSLLALCWDDLRTTVESAEKENKNDCRLKSAKTALDIVKKSADFGDEVHVSSVCMMHVKTNLQSIVDISDARGRALWYKLLECLHVHHITAPHTLKLMHSRRKAAMDLLQLRVGASTTDDKSLLKSLLYACTSETPFDPTGRKTVVSAKTVCDVFKTWIRNPKNITQELKITVDNMIYHSCHRLAAHIVRFGLDELKQLKENHVAGYVSTTELTHATVEDSVAVIKSNAVTRAMRQTLRTSIDALSGSNRTTEQPNITDGAVELILLHLRYTMWCAVAGLESLHAPASFSEGEWCKYINQSLESYVERTTTDFRDPDSWVLTNEPDVLDYEEDGSLNTPVSEIYSVDSQDERDDTEESPSTDCEDELRELAKPYPERRPEERVRPNLKIKRVHRTAAAANANVCDAARTSGGEFALSAANKVKRCWCVLCHKSKTTRELAINDELAIASCALCCAELNRQDAAKVRQLMMERIEARLLAPVMFTTVGTERSMRAVNLPIRTAKNMAPGTYNRRDPRFGQRLPTGLAKRPRCKRTRPLPTPNPPPPPPTPPPPST